VPLVESAANIRPFGSSFGTVNEARVHGRDLQTAD